MKFRVHPPGYWILGLAAMALSALLHAGPGLEHRARDPQYATQQLQDEFVDLRVQALAGEVEVSRRWSGSQWQWQRVWSDLELFGVPKASGVAQGAPSAIRRNDHVYLLSSEDDAEEPVYRSTLKYTITAKNRGQDGYEWRDSRGNLIRYDAAGRMTRVVNRQGQWLELVRTPQGSVSQVKDQFGQVLLSYHYSDQNGRERLDEVEDYSGRKVSYGYSGGQLSSVTDVLGHVWTYQYAAGELKFIDPEQRATVFKVDGKGRLSSRFDADRVGFSWSAQYDADQQQYYQAQTDGEGRITERWYNSLGHLIKESVNGEVQRSAVEQLSDDSTQVDRLTRQYTLRSISGSRAGSYSAMQPADRPDALYVKRRIETEARGQQTRYDYDATGNALRVTYPDGARRESRYDAQSQLLEQSEWDAGGQLVGKTTYEYFASGQLKTLTEAAGFAEERITRYQYDPQGRLEHLTRVGDAATAEAVETFDYDDYGNLISHTDAEGHTVTYSEHDALGNPKRVRNARGEETVTAYDDAGNPTHITSADPDGTGPLTALVSAFGYDQAGLLNRITRADGTVQELQQLTARGQPRQIVAGVDDNQQPIVSRFEYNRRGQRTQYQTPQGHHQHWQYDPAGRLQLYRDGEQHVTGYSYEHGLLRQIDYPTYSEERRYDLRQQPAGYTLQGVALSPGGAPQALNSTQRLDSLGRLIEQRDANDHVQKLRHDALGRLIDIEDADGKHTAFVYDDRDNLLQVTDPEGRSTYYSYSKTDQRKTERKQGQSVERSYQYDANGNLKQVTNPKGDRIEYDYDALDRQIAERRYPAATATVAERSLQYHYNAKGQYEGYSEGGQRIETRGYNGRGQLQSVTTRLGGEEKSYQYSYHPDGSLASYQNPEQQRYRYQYNGNGQIVSVLIPAVGSIVYDNYQWQRPQQILFPGGQRLSLGYDGLQRESTRQLQDKNAAELGRAQYHYDPVGNILAIDTHQGRQDYGYDPLDRLRSWSRKNSENTQEAGDHYDYDGVGNRLNSDAQPEWAYNERNQLQRQGSAASPAVSYEYDANGHTERKTEGSTVTDYVYDAGERLIEVKRNGSSVARYGYDAYGRRVSKTVNDVTTWYLYNEQGLAAEYQNGALQREYHFTPGAPWGTAPLFTRQNGEVLYYHNDHLGTPQQLVDGLGQVVWSAKYEAFGKAEVTAHAEVVNNLRFPGQYYDEETGTHYNYHRDYEPGIGRYIESDPIGLGGGGNTYGYVGNTPQVGVDPRGLAWSRRDFYDHYMSGGGDVTLQEVGLYDQFINHGSVQRGMRAVYDAGRNSLLEKLARKCIECKTPTVSDSVKTDPWDQEYDVTPGYSLADMQNPIFNMGGGVLFNQGVCEGTLNCKSRKLAGKCVIRFYIRDKYEDPADLFDLIPGRIDWGAPYRIKGDWNRTYSF